MHCWNETSEMSAKCRKFSVLLAGELQFHFAGGRHCETIIRNFVLFRSVVAVVGYLNLWKNSACHMHIHRRARARSHTHTHTHRLDINFSVCTDSADTYCLCFLSRLFVSLSSAKIFCF